MKLKGELFIFAWDNDFEIFVGRNTLGESFAEICRPLHQIWSTMSKNGTHRRSTPNGLRATPMSKYELKIWYSIESSWSLEYSYIVYNYNKSNFDQK